MSVVLLKERWNSSVQKKFALIQPEACRVEDFLYVIAYHHVIVCKHVIIGVMVKSIFAKITDAK